MWCRLRALIHEFMHISRWVQVATQTVAQMLALEAIDPTADIKLYINSMGDPHSPGLFIIMTIYLSSVG